MALLILDEKCLVMHHENFSLSSTQTQQVIIRDQWQYLQLIHDFKFYCVLIVLKIGQPKPLANRILDFLNY